MKIYSDRENGKGYRRNESASPQDSGPTCAYVSGNGIRCRHPGGIAMTVKERPTTWYCRWHWQERGTRFADDVAEDSYSAECLKTVRPWWDETRESRQAELGLPDRMTRDEAMRVIGQINPAFGKLLSKYIGRGELMPRIDPDDPSLYLSTDKR